VVRQYILSQDVCVVEQLSSFFDGRSKMKLLLEMNFEVFMCHVKIILQLRTKVELFLKIPKNPL